MLSKLSREAFVSDLPGMERSALSTFPQSVQPNLFAEVLSRRQHAVNVEGPRTLGSTRRTAAIHEASHAVIWQITACDRVPPPESVVVFKEKAVPSVVGETWLGYVTPKQCKYLGQYADPRDTVLQYAMGMRFISGLVGERLFNPGDARMGSCLDEVVATQVVAANLALQPGLDEATAYAKITRWTASLLRANAEVVIAIADRLEKHGSVQGTALEELLQRVITSTGKAPELFEGEGP
jgi:hypothetical protein